MLLILMLDSRFYSSSLLKIKALYCYCSLFLCINVYISALWTDYLSYYGLYAIFTGWSRILLYWDKGSLPYVLMVLYCIDISWFLRWGNIFLLFLSSASFLKYSSIVMFDLYYWIWGLMASTTILFKFELPKFSWGVGFTKFTRIDLFYGWAAGGEGIL